MGQQAEDPVSDQPPDGASFYGRWFAWVYRHPVLGPLPFASLVFGGALVIGLVGGFSWSYCLVVSGVAAVTSYVLALATNWRGVPQRRWLSRHAMTLEPGPMDGDDSDDESGGESAGVDVRPSSPGPTTE